MRLETGRQSRISLEIAMAAPNYQKLKQGDEPCDAFPEGENHLLLL
jgi:hypothetical protein